jgi:hypothetical protein
MRSSWYVPTLAAREHQPTNIYQLRSLKYVLLPDTSGDPTATRGGSSYTVARAQKNRRTYFLALYAFVVQMLFMWILSREEAAVKTVASRLAGPKL